MRTIRYREIAELPKLAWLATLENSSGELSVIHGSAVERRDHWMVEGTWDGDFSSGDFHLAENFFGSGIRVDGDQVHFVSSSALVDRLVFCHDGDRILVSNSLTLLLAFTGSRLDPTHSYRHESYAILRGINKYSKEFVVSHPTIKTFYQVYHENLIVENGDVSFHATSRIRDLQSFEEYHELLREVLSRIKENYSSSGRTIPLSVFSTMSSGYDSTAVSTLVREIGVDTCFTSRRSNSTVPRWISERAAVDDGTPIADVLGFKTLYLRDPAEISENELYFLGASAAWPETVFHSMAEHVEKNCAAAVVFTGYHGGGLWDVNQNGRDAGADLVRKDTSGFNLCEIRLKAGFINVDFGCTFARSVQSIAKISHSPEMEPWRMHNDYDKPIPRRIVEQAGVDRNLFGTRKKAVVQYYNYPVHPKLRASFFEFVRREHGLSPSFVYAHQKINQWGFPLVRLGERAANLVLRSSRETKQNFFRNDVQLPYWMFFWAVDSLRETTADILTRNDVARTASVSG